MISVDNKKDLRKIGGLLFFFQEGGGADADEDDDGTDDAGSGEHFAEDQKGKGCSQYGAGALEQCHGAVRDFLQCDVLQQITKDGAHDPQIEDSKPNRRCGDIQTPAAVKGKGANGGDHRRYHGLGGGEGKGIHLFQGFFTKYQRSCHHQCSKKCNDFTKTKGGQTAQAAKEIKSDHNKDQNWDQFFVDGFAVDQPCQNRRDDHRQRSQKGNGCGCGELQADVIQNIG